MADIPNFQPRTQPIDPTALVSATQNKVKIEHDAQQQRKQRQMELVQGIVKAVEQGQAIAMNQLKLSSERSKLGAQKELAGLMMRPAADKPVAEGIQNAATGKNYTPTYGTTQTGAEELKERPAAIQSALFRSNPDAFTKEMTEAQFPGRSSAGMPYLPIPISLKDGTDVYATYDKANGVWLGPDKQPIPPEMIGNRGYALDFKTDAEGNIIALDKGSGKKKGNISSAGGNFPQAPDDSVSNLSSLPKGVRDEVVKVINTSQVEPTLKKEKEIFVQMNRLEQAVDANNPSLAGKLGLVFQRALGDTGNIALAEQRMPGSSQLFEQAKQLWSTYIKDGNLSPDNKESLKEAIGLLRDVSYENYQNLLDIETDQIKSVYPQLNRDFLRKSIGGYLATRKTSSDPVDKELQEAKKELDALRKQQQRP
jgi:hypothetical protein